MPAEWWDFLRQWTPWELKLYYWRASAFYTSWWFLGGTLAIILWERFQPAVPSQRLLSKGLAEDSIWLNIELASRAILIPPTVVVLAAGYQWLTGGATLAFVAAWPSLVKILLSLLVFDFLEYACHWVRHRVSVLWRFHVVHHSQRELNLFSASRNHVVEYIVLTAFVAAPMLAFGMTPFAIMGTAMGVGLHARLVHANIRSNFGPLGYIFVSPQFHRVHHSIEPDQVDRNFGLIFSFWDRMFGTIWNDRSSYPRTGVEGVHQAPSSFRPGAVIRAVWSELLYPFRRTQRADRA